MKLGFIGAGNMATALARGIGDPVVATDRIAGKAEALVEQVGGEAVESAAEVADASDAVVLAHKPAQLSEVAREVDGKADIVVSILGGVPTGAIEAAYPGAAVHRFLPNIPVEVRQGVLCYAHGSKATGSEQLIELFGRAG